MKEFEHPYVVGMVGCRVGSKKNLLLKKRFEAAFKKARLPFAYLLLETEAKHLKNLLECMTLMDVIGVNLSASLEISALKYIKNIDKTAKTAKKINIIAKKGKSFVGYYFKNDLIKRSLALWKYW
ncbi:MAG: hypothetical protein COV46_04995 [Deltaproteobacteria bacterium CG11_big_fil_rev_8_21_14_0_20_49_13]|nr:MAG: hypothetical protein COV46_04995 [Deltaproteobacteria bacterium CG11_big_fil_rev_8_21_14_0_20_49_13]